MTGPDTEANRSSLIARLRERGVICDRQAVLRAKLPQTLKAAGVDPADLVAIQKAYLNPT